MERRVAEVEPSDVRPEAGGGRLQHVRVHVDEQHPDVRQRVEDGRQRTGSGAEVDHQPRAARGGQSTTSRASARSAACGWRGRTRPRAPARDDAARSWRRVVRNDGPFLHPGQPPRRLGFGGDRRSRRVPRRAAGGGRRRVRRARRRRAGRDGAVAWLGLFEPSRGGAGVGRGRVRSARAGGRGRRQGAPAAEARALRRHALRRPAAGALRRRDRDGRVRRGRHLRRPELRDHRAARRGARPRPRPAARSRRGRSSCSAGRSRSSTASSTTSSTATCRWSAGLENDIDEIEDEVFGGSATVSRRIYELAREVIEFQRATKPLAGASSPQLDRPAGRRRRGAALPARRAGPRDAHRGAGRRLPRRSCRTS